MRMTRQTDILPARAADDSPVVLLVDDERAFADTLAFRLGARGLPCLVAYRADDALPLLERPGIEVVLLDLNMPGLHGLEALRLFKARRPDVEVLLLTGESDLAAAATGMRRGAGDYLLKPVDLESLLEAVVKARKRVAEHKERLRAAEAGKLMALGALAAGVGHEINNPLQIILQRSEWLQELMEDARDGRADYDEMLKSVAVVQAQARRAGEITAQLLGLAHKSREGTAESDPAALAERVAARAAERAQSLKASIVVEIDGPPPLIACSPAELEPVLIHLMQNALDAIEAKSLRPAGSPDGPPDGEKASQTTDKVLVRIGKKADTAVIEVQDTGEGIDPELVRYIFDPFFSLRPVGKGTGLGLTVCHSIVAALRGNIVYRPAEPRGALFIVEIPVSHGPDAAGKAETNQPKDLS